MHRLLIADDNDDIRHLLEMVLAGEGYDVSAVEDGSQALRSYGASLRECRPYSLLILDCAMPVLTGTSVAMRVRELGDPVPIVFMTAHSKSLLVDDLKRYEISDVFEKPMDADSLKARVAQLISPA